MVNLLIYYPNLIRDDSIFKELFPNEVIINNLEDLISRKPTLILALGKEALCDLLDISKVKKTRGKLLYSNKVNCKFIASLDPQKIKTNKSEILKFNKYLIDKRLLLEDYKYFKTLATSKQNTNHTYICILEKDRCLFDKFIEKISTLQSWAFDIETDEDEFFRIENAKVLGIGFSWKAGTGAYIQLRNQFNQILDEEFKYRIENLKILFANQAKKIGHNGKYDSERLLYTLGITVNNFSFDTMLAAHLLDENKRIGLDSLSYLAEDLAHYKEESVVFLPKKGSSYANIPTLILAKRCCADADLTNRLELYYNQELNKYPRINSLYNQIVMPHQHIVMGGEVAGVLIDISELNRIDPIIKNALDTVENSVYDSINEKINLNSNKQIRELFIKLRLDIPKDCLTELGEISTNQDTLERIKKQHIFCEKLIKYKQLFKLYTTYIVGIRNRLCSDNTIHTSYKLTGTVTGRLCVAKGTKIEVIRDNSKYPSGIPIEDVKPGNLVYSYDSMGNLSIKPVLWSGKTGRRKVIRVHWLSTGRHTKGYVDVTPEHPILLVSGTYKQAKDLCKNDRVMSLSRGIFCGYSRLWPNNHIITKLEILPYPVEVYDIEVKDTHNFIANEICVHNSSSQPNLQNIPTNTTLKQLYNLKNISIHRLFIARPGYKFVVSDASQIELRMLAVLSGDETFINAFLNNEDAHTLTALKIIPNAKNVYYEYKHLIEKDPLSTNPIIEKWKYYRAIGKKVNFGIAYGQGAKNLSQELDISIRQSQTYINDFFNNYPKIHEWKYRSIGFCKKYGYIEDLYGRRRRLPDITSFDSYKQSQAERQCINSAVQGSAADTTAIANIRINKLFKEYNIDGGFRLNVHDEIVFEVKEDQADKSSELIKKGWLDPIKILKNVPLDISISISNSWEK